MAGEEEGKHIPSAWLFLSPTCFWKCCSPRVCKHHLKTLIAEVILYANANSNFSETVPGGFALSDSRDHIMSKPARAPALLEAPSSARLLSTYSSRPSQVLKGLTCVPSYSTATYRSASTPHLSWASAAWLSSWCGALRSPWRTWRPTVLLKPRFTQAI